MADPTNFPGAEPSAESTAESSTEPSIEPAAEFRVENASQSADNPTDNPTADHTDDSITNSEADSTADSIDDFPASFTTMVNIQNAEPEVLQLLKCVMKGEAQADAISQKTDKQLGDTDLEEGRTADGYLDVQDIDISKFLRDCIFKLDNVSEDNEVLLLKIRDRISNAGMNTPTVEVRYQDLTAEAQVYVGGRALPTLYNTILNFFDLVLNTMNLSRGTKKPFVILESISGIIKPGRMTLLLGPPGGGKTTFLQALAGQSDHTLKTSGEVTYNGCKFSEFQPRKTSTYVSQDDSHIPEFTVRETMEYAAIFQGFKPQQEFMSELLRREDELSIRPDPEVDIFMKGLATKDIFHQFVTEYFMKILGLDVCADTIVGSHLRKGLSGGQRKRLTAGEMIVGPTNVLLLDDISTGLDSSTTYQIIKCMSQFASILNKTILISLLQPAPETFNLFEDVILLTSGQVAYHGPCDKVEHFFETCGFKRPPRKGLADYLQEVTSIKDQEQYWANEGQAYSFVPARKFVDAFKAFSTGQKLSQELALPLDPSKSQKKALSYDYFSLSYPDLIKKVFQKELLFTKKNFVVEVAIASQMLCIALIVGAIFFRTERNHDTLQGAQQYGGALFILYLSVSLLGFGEVTLSTIRFPSLIKFKTRQFYPAWAWTITNTLIKIPLGTIEAAACMGVAYYLVGLAPAASRFSKMMLLMSAMVMMSSGLFRTIAAVLQTQVLSSSVGGYFMVVILLLGGFIMPRSDIPKYLIWAYWALPLSYGQNGIVVNEFLDHRWQKPLPDYTHTIGHQYILNTSMYDKGWWYWLAFGAEIAFAIGFNILIALFTTLMKAPSKSRAVLSESVLKMREDNRIGESEAGVGRLPGPEADQSSNNVSRGESSASKAYLASETGSKSPSVGSDQQDDGTHEASDHFQGRRGMVLPFQPYGISFKDINYSVDMPKEFKERGATEDKLQLLHNVTGAFRPGVLTALVGVTGAGKSTLMDVLAGRKTVGYTDGDIRINGHPKRHETFTRIAAYCEQNDIHSSQLTVHESVTFSAWVRLASEIDTETKENFIEEVLDLVELDSLRDALVGVPLESGLSTEQRKRLTIAVELVSNPSIIFMDEPTTGLDARAAAVVMRAVRNIVSTGRTVICTIHQPSIDIFESFDELLLLKRGGYVIYAGPLGAKSHHLIDYFQKNADVPLIKDEENPAAWMLDITQPGLERKLGVDFAEVYRESSAYKDMEELVNQMSIPFERAKDIEFSTEYALPLWGQYKMCLWKQNWTHWRSPGYNLMRVLLSLALALTQGILFWGYGKKINSERKLHSIFGTFFVTNNLYGLLSCMSVQPLTHYERTVFYRERGARMYSEIPYALSQLTMEMPYTFVTSSLFQLVVYSMLKFPWNAGKFFWQLYFTFVSQVTYIFLGMVTVALTSIPELATTLATFALLLSNLPNGFLLTLPDMNPWTKWLFWINPSAYFLYGSIEAQFGDLDNLHLTTRQQEVLSLPTYLQRYYGFRHYLLPLVATISLLVPFLYAIGYVYSVKKVNFQKR